MINLIAFFCFLLASLAICTVSTLCLKGEKLAPFIMLKTCAVFSVLILLIASANLGSSFNGTAIFILLAIIIQMISQCLKAIPTKNDIFSSITGILDAITPLMIAISALLVLASPIPLPVGFGVGAIVAGAFFISQKRFDVKKDISNCFELAFSFALLAQSIFNIIFLQKISNILLLVGSIVFVAYEVIKIFIKTDEYSKKILTARTALFYASLILIAISVYF